MAERHDGRLVWVGLDDTDSVHGGCTTFLAYRLVALAPWDLVGVPRLVRLNPTVPWKTRGNAALCLRFGEGRGARTLIGASEGRPLRAYMTGRGGPDPQEVLEFAWSIGERTSGGFQLGSNPGIFATVRRPRPSLYWHAVRRVVRVTEYAGIAARLGSCRSASGRRGLVGAVAATAWRPRDRTYEVLAYREEGRWGKPREVDPEAVLEVERRFPTTFNSYDHSVQRVVLAPHSHCPVLFGIRGDVAQEVVRASRLLTSASETTRGWMLFETNQGTDDHVFRHPRALGPRTTVEVRGRMASPPRSLPGGHVVFRLEGRWATECTAYEPSKGFRNVVRALLPGDEVTVVGSVRVRPRTLNLEKLRVDRLVPDRRKVANPFCPCGRRMKSLGRGAPFRCRACGRRAPLEAATFVEFPRTLREGWYEPPVSARRHLSKPLKRMGLGESWAHPMTVRTSIPSGWTK